MATSRAKAKWALHVDIFEPEGAGMGYPVVRHSFYGKTKKEAKGYFKAHLGTCSFMRECVKTGRFTDFMCPSFWRWEKLS